MKVVEDSYLFVMPCSMHISLM